MQESLSPIARQVKKSDYYRYLCCLFVPEKQRENLFTIYAFNNEITKIKDITSEAMTGHIRLQWWREAIDQIYSSKTPRNHDVVNALSKMIKDTAVPKELFTDLIDAHEKDVDFQIPKNMQALDKYLTLTCSNLIILTLTASDNHNEHTKEAAYHTGIAYSLAGIMRSIRHNAYKRRIMYPQELMEEQKITPEEIIEGKNLEKTKIMTKALYDKAISHMQQARALKKDLQPPALPYFLPLTVAECFLKRIKRNNFDLFNTNMEHGRLGIQTKLFINSCLGKY